MYVCISQGIIILEEIVNIDFSYPNLATELHSLP